jgi:replicative DNA helicase
MSLVALEAERAILGLILAGRLPVRDVSELAPAEFDGPGHGYVWEAMLSLAAEGKPSDHLTVADRLRARGRLPEVGLGPKDERETMGTGPAYLMAMDQTLANPENIRAYVASIREAAQRRALEGAGRKIIGLAHDPHMPPARAALEGAQALQAIKSTRPLRMGGKDVIAQQERWERAMRGEVQPYLPVPHQALAGVFPGFVDNLNVVAGRSGGFKTGLLADCIWHWTHNLGHRGGVFGLEDGTGWAFDRLTARELGMNYGEVGYRPLNDMQKELHPAWCERAFPVLNERLFVYDTSDCDEEALASDTPIADWPDVLQEVKRWLVEGVRFIVIDHGLRIRYTTSKERYDMAIGRAMDTLANLGARHKCAIIVLWHLNRDGEEEEMPRLKDLKESSYLDAAMRSCIINWERPDDFPGAVLSTVVKHTRGAKGVTVALEKEQGGRFGLLHRERGRVVDFAAEARAKAEARQSASRVKRAGLFPAGGVGA